MGMLFAATMKVSHQGSPLCSRAFIAGSVVVCLFIAIVAYSYILAPSWMFMYFVDPTLVPTWLIVYFLLLYYVTYVLGFLLHRELHRLSSTVGWVALGIMLVASVAVIAPLWEEYTTVATYHDFQEGVGGVPLNESALGRFATPATGVLLVVALSSLYWARRQPLKAA